MAGETRRSRTQLRLESAEQAAEAALLRSQGLNYRQIADRQGCSAGTAYKRVQRAIAAIPMEAVDELRRIECDRLDAVIAKLWDIVHAEHPMVSHGRLIRRQIGWEVDSSGVEVLDPLTNERIPVWQTIEDAGPVLSALNGIVRASESKRKLLGLDAPTRTQVHVITEDLVDEEIRRLEEELAARAGS